MVSSTATVYLTIHHREHFLPAGGCLGSPGPDVMSFMSIDSKSQPAVQETSTTPREATPPGRKAVSSKVQQGPDSHTLPRVVVTEWPATCSWSLSGKHCINRAPEHATPEPVESPERASCTSQVWVLHSSRAYHYATIWTHSRCVIFSCPLGHVSPNAGGRVQEASLHSHVDQDETRGQQQIFKKLPSCTHTLTLNVAFLINIV